MFEFDKEENIKWANKANITLGFEREIVGVRFIFTKEEFDELDISQPNGRMPYCRMIVRASHGEDLKSNFENFGCFGGARALGIVDPENYYESGRFFEPRGLYRDLATSHYVTERIERINHELYGIHIAPLKNSNIEPDVVIIITKPYQIMRLVQGYAYNYGTLENIKMVGNQAICAETTAHPYNHNNVNVSSLCIGARKSGMNDYELSIGIVYNKFAGTIDGVCKTVTPIETNTKKDEIHRRLKNRDMDDITIIKNTNYNKPFAKRDLLYFKNQRLKNTRDYEKSLDNIFSEDK